MGPFQSLLKHNNRVKTKFQVMSDLHLEIGQQYADFVIPAEAPYLVLAGDIGRLKDYQSYLEFIVRQCVQFTRVFLVLGNHEFFGVSHTEGLRLARCLEKEPGCSGKLHVMSRNRVDLESSLGLTILGCTLQSSIPPEAKTMVQMKVNDFKRIEGWTVDDHNSEHQRDLEWLQKEIQTIRSEECQFKRSIFVITHHAPAIQGTSRPSDLVKPWSCAFSTDLLAHKALADTQLWVFGHTHFSCDFKQGEVRLVSNQRGYVLHGVRLQKESPKRTKRSLFSSYAKSKGSKDNNFDVSKVIKVYKSRSMN